jgi:opacity protein-like surface antigen
MIAQRFTTGLALALAVLCSAAAVPVAHADSVTELAGTSWSGSGQLKFAQGQTEAVRCKAYYTRRIGGVGIAMRCASVGQSIDLRAQLLVTGTKVSGTWEERSFNAAGQATGTSDGNKLQLAIDGGGLKATMAVTTDGQKQSVLIASEGTALRGVTIALSRDAP